MRKYKPLSKPFTVKVQISLNYTWRRLLTTLYYHSQWSETENINRRSATCCCCVFVFRLLALPSCLLPEPKTIPKVISKFPIHFYFFLQVFCLCLLVICSVVFNLNTKNIIYILAENYLVSYYLGATVDGKETIISSNAVHGFPADAYVIYIKLYRKLCLKEIESRCPSRYFQIRVI